LARLLNALPIRHVGVRVATILAETFHSMDSLQEATVEQLSDINEVGPVIAESVFEFLHSEHGAETVRRLAELGVVQSQERSSAVEPTNQIFAGKTFVVTGKLQKHTRDEIHELVSRHGGRASSSVSKSTAYLVAGEKAGSKLAKAEQLGVQVLSEADFEALLKEQ